MRSPLPRPVAVIVSAAFITAASAGCGGTASTSTGSAPAGGAAGTVAAEQARGAAPGGAKIAGIAFVDSSVTGQGSRATLPAGATVHAIGATITGTEGCPTNQYGTDGLIVAVIDYTGRPTAGSLTITEHRAGASQKRAPYYLDLNTGRTLQFLGPIVQNGSFDLELEYDLAQGRPNTDKGQFVLARSCAR